MSSNNYNYNYIIIFEKNLIFIFSSSPITPPSINDLSSVKIILLCFLYVGLTHLYFQLLLPSSSSPTFPTCSNQKNKVTSPTPPTFFILHQQKKQIHIVLGVMTPNKVWIHIHIIALPTTPPMSMWWLESYRDRFGNGFVGFN